MPVPVQRPDTPLTRLSCFARRSLQPEPVETSLAAGRAELLVCVTTCIADPASLAAQLRTGAAQASSPTWLNSWQCCLQGHIKRLAQTFGALPDIYKRRRVSGPDVAQVRSLGL